MMRHALTLCLTLSACILSCLASGPDGKWQLLPRDDLRADGKNKTHSCCLLLSSRLEVYYPGDTEYIRQQTDPLDGYWSGLASSLEPACRVSPKQTEDVAVAVSTLVQANCKFAVKGGGHTTWAGAANIQDGITIDLGELKTVTLEGSVASVGGGARWRDVYPKLEQSGVAAVGGRHGPIGVGGLVTSGGNSFFGPLYGFACDNVVNFEVVLASGKTVQANDRENRDLYRALKGGSNNFGIVTRFDLRTFALGQVWGGWTRYAPNNNTLQHYQALQNFTTASGDGLDPYASVMNVNVWAPSGHIGTAHSLFYAKPQAYPPILKVFTDIQPTPESTMRIDRFANVSADADASFAVNERALFSTISIGNDAQLCDRIFTITDLALAPLLNSTGFGAGLNIQPVSRATTGQAKSTGGNSLGLSPEEGDFLLVQLSVGWASPADDARFIAMSESAIRQYTTAAREAGLYKSYIDVTHAAPFQDPLPTYGKDNLARLRATSKKYDPDGVFQKLVPGGFKLFPQNAGIDRQY